ncbi:MAG: threonine synthase [Vampirovibrionales bacterium]|nr:threonine synthase [Vampirovibrionales bacterium]
MMYTGLLNHYQSFFNLPKTAEVITLHEGQTPLIPAPRLAALLAQETGIEGLRIYLKYDGLNPTGSFKDRGMTCAMTYAKHDGARFVLCASTGNTSASAAAYAARADLETLIIIPKGKIALGKLAQALLYGATIVEIEGNFDQALNIVRAIGEQHADQVAVVNSINPHRISGQRSAAFEVVDALGKAPDYLMIPVGNAGNITAYWQGFKDYQAAGKTAALPKMMGYQAAGAAPIVHNQPIEHPETLATAIRIGNPASWKLAVEARDASGGRIDAVSDEQIIQAYQRLGQLEGVFCEPASAASVAGLFKAAQARQIEAGQTVVCVLTGNGLKDPANGIKASVKQAKRVSLPPDAQTVAQYFGF